MLHINEGDCVAFEIVQGQVVLKKVPTLDWEYIGAVSETLSEWTSEAEESAYDDL